MPGSNLGLALQRFRYSDVKSLCLESCPDLERSCCIVFSFLRLFDYQHQVWNCSSSTVKLPSHAASHSLLILIWIFLGSVFIFQVSFYLRSLGFRCFCLKHFLLAVDTFPYFQKFVHFEANVSLFTAALLEEEGPCETHAPEWNHCLISTSEKALLFDIVVPFFCLQPNFLVMADQDPAACCLSPWSFCFNLTSILNCLFDSLCVNSGSQTRHQDRCLIPLWTSATQLSQMIFHHQSNSIHEHSEIAPDFSNSNFDQSSGSCWPCSSVPGFLSYLQRIYASSQAASDSPAPYSITAWNSTDSDQLLNLKVQSHFDFTFINFPLDIF